MAREGGSGWGLRMLCTPLCNASNYLLKNVDPSGHVVYGIGLHPTEGMDAHLFYLTCVVYIAAFAMG